jgi:hypothetical protein
MIFARIPPMVLILGDEVSPRASQGWHKFNTFTIHPSSSHGQKPDRVRKTAPSGWPAHHIVPGLAGGKTGDAIRKVLRIFNADNQPDQ